MIIVTGGAGFIGSNIVAGLNQQGIHDILVVDNLKRGPKFRNLADLSITDYMDKADFIALIAADKTFASDITAVFHQGACSSTTEQDGRYMMMNNYDYSKSLLHYCLKHTIPFYYASSAAVYGGSNTFKEDLAYEKPLNVYGYSKYLFDQYVRAQMPKANSPIVGLRYFNVYGPRENHKGSMASVAYHLHQQILAGEDPKLFEGTQGYGHGEQLRDFICVDDVVAVNLWLKANPSVSGIFNVGTGQSRSFNDLASAVIDWHKKGKISYIPFPKHLQGAYQAHTQADISQLRAAGYDAAFKSVEQGVRSYLDWLVTHRTHE